MEDREVVVVGGGPAGSSTANLLAQLGHDVLLLESARFPRDKLCGESVSPGAWACLDRLGVVPAVRALAPQPLLGMRLRSPDGTSFEGRHSVDASSAGFAVTRRQLDAVLLQAAVGSGVELREGARCAGFASPDGSRILVYEQAGQQREVRARLVVAAEGRRSRLARQLGLLTEHPRLRKFAVRGYWSGVEGLGAFGELHVARAGYCGVAPLSGTRCNATFVLDRTAFGPAAAGQLEGFYRARLLDWPALAERLAGARLEGPVTAVGPLALTARQAWAPGVLLVGDAAGFFDPFTGEGVLLALLSAEWATDAAHRALTSNSIADLRAYERTRRLHTAGKLRINQALYAALAWPRLANFVAHLASSNQSLADGLVAFAGDYPASHDRTGLARGLRLLVGSGERLSRSGWTG